MSQETYDQLEEMEKVALRCAILYPHRNLRDVLPKLFTSSWPLTTYYRGYYEGVEKLNEKGILDEQDRPTDKAFEELHHFLGRRAL